MGTGQAEGVGKWGPGEPPPKRTMSLHQGLMEDVLRPPNFCFSLIPLSVQGKRKISYL